MDRRAGIERGSLSEMLHRCTPVSDTLFRGSRCPEKVCVAGRDSPAVGKLLQGASRGARDLPLVFAQRRVTFETVWRKGDGLFRRLPGTVLQLGRRCRVDVQKRTGP